MVERVSVDEISVGREAGVIPIFDVGALDFVAAPVGAFARSSGLVVPAVRQKLVPNAPVIGFPHSDVRMVCPVHLAAFFLGDGAAAMIAGGRDHRC